MTKIAIVISVALTALWAVPATAAAPEGEIAPPPSPFETGMRGFGMGIGAGLAGGYLVARSGGFHSGDWRPLVAGAAIGALAGGALGVTLGIVDNASATPGRGFLVMRGMTYGGSFGAVFGGLIGALAALKTNHLENVLLGAAIGTLSGTVLGVVYGSVERNPWATGGRARPKATAWNIGIAPWSNAKGTLSWGPGISGRF